jgi:hypothetical protein
LAHVVEKVQCLHYGANQPLRVVRGVREVLSSHPLHNFLTLDHMIIQHLLVSSNATRPVDFVRQRNRTLLQRSVWSWRKLQPRKTRRPQIDCRDNGMVTSSSVASHAFHVFLLMTVNSFLNTSRLCLRSAMSTSSPTERFSRGSWPWHSHTTYNRKNNNRLALVFLMRRQGKRSRTRDIK